MTERDVAPAPPDDHLPPPPLVRSHRPRASAALFTAAAVIAAGMAVAVATTSVGGTDDGGETATGLPAEVLSGADTPLPDGFTVPEGAALVGPVVVTAVDAAGEPADWAAVLAVVGDDPLAVWRGYVAQIADAHPDLDPDNVDVVTCRPYAVPSNRDGGSPHIAGLDPLCELYVGPASAELTSIRGDVTGRWLLTVSGDDTLDWKPVSELELDRGQGTVETAPPPQEPRAQPAIGEPLAPDTTASESDDERYVLLDGSELLAQHGTGSITGGFGVLLRVTPGADVLAVAAAYADQANQLDGEPVPPPAVVEHDGTIVTAFVPPGGAGGYSGYVAAVDGPGAGDDYILYDLSND
jgi:hypothetical protein